jgi:histone H3/H4
MAGLVVKSAVKAKAPKGMRVSGDLYDGLDKAVADLLNAAAKRAKANGRSTIRAADL